MMIVINLSRKTRLRIAVGRSAVSRRVYAYFGVEQYHPQYCQESKITMHGRTDVWTGAWVTARDWRY